MNSIDILEEKEKEAIKDLKELSHYCSLRAIDIDDKHSDLWARYIVSIQIVKNLIETLIAENKELKEEIKEINEEYNAEQKHEMENTIPKSKVEELKDKIHRELEINAVTRRDLIYVDLNLARIDQYFNKLLGKE